MLCDHPLLQCDMSGQGAQQCWPTLATRLPHLQVQVVPAKKKVVDDYVIILACVLGGLLVLPLVAWVGRRAWLARQHRKVRG